MSSALPGAHGRLHAFLFRLQNIARWLRHQPVQATGPGADYHFVQEYERLVTKLLVRYPIDKAMSRAVGGILRRSERWNARYCGMQGCEMV